MTIETIAKAAERALSSAKATAAKHVWEKYDGGWKYIISLHGLLCDGTPLIHTKIIFWAEEDKSTLRKNALTYLYDLNCVYRTFEFADEAAVEHRVSALVKNAQFGVKLKDLSDVMIDGMARTNAVLAKDGVHDINVLAFDYTPQLAITPCATTVFDFKLNVSGGHTIALRVSYVPQTAVWKLQASTENAAGAGVNGEVGEADEIPFQVAKMVTKMLHKN